MKKPLVANLYNPHEQSKEQLIERFVVRQNVFQELYQAISASVTQQTATHYLIEGQRGTGKTTLLLRLGYAIEEDAELRAKCMAVVLKEEAYYGIRQLWKLWETVAQELEAKDKRFAGLSQQMLTASEHQIDAEQTYCDMLMNALQMHAKTLLLFIDNIGEMLSNFTADENKRLREILATSPQIQILGATAVALEAFLTHDHPFYGFFIKKRLEEIDKDETYTLLLELAKAYHQENAIRTIIKNQPGRVESLRILTGGVIRTIVLLFEIFAEREESNTLADLDVVLDKVTPLYKSRMDDLTPLQRDVVNTIALAWEAANAEEIARKTRLELESVQTILHELENVFIIEQVTSDTQSPLYRLKERFFNVWYLMRLSSGGSRAKVLWLLHFLESWYSREEFVQHARQHIKAVSAGKYQPKAAYYLTEAFAQSGRLDAVSEQRMLHVTKRLLEENASSLAAALSVSDKDMFEEGEKYYQRGEYDQAITWFLKMKQKNDAILFRIGDAFSKSGHFSDAAVYWSQAAERGHIDAMLALGGLYHQQLRDHSQAERYYCMASDKGQLDAMLQLANLYAFEMKDYPNAEQYYLMTIKEGQVRATVLSSQNFSLKALKDYLITAIKGAVKETERYQFSDFGGAKAKYLEALEATTADAMFQLGTLYVRELQDMQKAEKYYRLAAEYDRTDAMIALADLYHDVLKKDEDAEKYYLLAAEKGSGYAQLTLAMLYHNVFKQIKKAEKYYQMAAANGEVGAMNGVAWLYFEQKIKKRDSLKYARQAVEKEKNIYTLHTLACVYVWNNQTKKALECAEAFLYDADAYATLEQDIFFFLMLLLAKQEHQAVTTYFAASDIHGQERFTPLYYAFLQITNSPDSQKLPPELSTPVTDIIAQIHQMAKEYA